MEETPQLPISQLAEAERFQLFVTGVTDYAIYMLSPEGYIRTWNAGAQRFKGYTADEIIGQHFSRFYTPEDRAAGKPARGLRTALEQDKFEDEGWRMRKDGTRFWASVVIDPIRDKEGTLIGFAKITRDITERRQAAEALERAKEALFQSQKLEAIGKLTSGIVHDFNNLLSVVVSGLELLGREVHSPSGIRTIESMRRAVAGGSALTQKLLSFARQQPLRTDRCNLNRAIGAFEAILRQAGNASVRFELKLATQLDSVLVDTMQFEAALLNLVSNARDAMPDGGTLTILTENVQLADHQAGSLPAGRYVRVAVQDTGTGMPAEVAARAIDPFFTTKETGKGTGLGLSQVYGLVQQSGGDVAIETEVGKGTTVSLYLPALASGQGTGAASADAYDGNETVLIVDDQPEVLDVAIELFRNMGYDVLSANNGADAMEILKRTPDIDVLFTDVLMPGISGIALGKEARKLVPGVKVILTSGYAAPALVGENADLGNFEFIHKPYRIAEVMRALRTAA